MTTHHQDRQEIDESRFARSVLLWIGIALPVSFAAITLVMWLVLDVSLEKAVAISIWPAVLTGVFGGGFVGVVRGSR